MLLIRAVFSLMAVVAIADAHPANYCWSCRRDAHGRIQRSASARAEFKRAHPCPVTGLSTGPCRGYVIDYVIPLHHGGLDEPWNMQWQTRAAAAKDRME